MYTLYLLQYNNYYNRIIQMEETLADYINHYPCIALQNVNFCTHDGVNATQVINEDASAYNYAIYQDENLNLLRYFILESKQTRGGQYALTLRRDLVTDYFEQIKGSPFYCVKGRVNANNPLIYNSEDITVNQIKTDEVQIKDATKMPWIVGYFAKTTENITWSKKSKFIPDYVEATAAGWKWFDALTTPKLSARSDIAFRNYYTSSSSLGYAYNITFNINGLIRYEKRKTQDIQGNCIHLLDAYRLRDSNVGFLASNLDPNGTATEQVITLNCLTEEDENEIKGLNGKYIKFIDLDKIYQIQVESGQFTRTYTSNADTVSAILDATLQDFVPGFLRSRAYEYEISGQAYEINLIEAAADEIGGTISKDTILLSDAPYKMFTMPYADCDVVVNGTTINMKKETALMAAMGIAESGTSVLYDIQLLPYSPCMNLWDGEKLILNTPDSTLDSTYSYIKSGDDNIGVIIWCQQSSFRAISFDYTVKVDDLKVSTVCDMLRLCSPNYNGNFEFSPARNGGSVDYFDIECTYKPFSPYIHVSPNFAGLYGRDFDDARGLICGGDFSLATASESWKQYEIQNKNYQVSFDRQIQNMELHQKVSFASDVLGALTGATSAAIAGASIGGPAAVAGAIGSTIAGVADVAVNTTLRQEQMKLAKDQFQYSLGNIKALPNNLTKVSAFNINNKIFPFIEVYTCTETERNLVSYKIKYEGMAIGAIGTILDFYIEPGDFVKGSMILTTDGFQNGDSHELEEMNIELSKGVYLRL